MLDPPVASPMVAALSQVQTTAADAKGTITGDEAAVLLLLVALGVVALLVMLLALLAAESPTRRR